MTEETRTKLELTCPQCCVPLEIYVNTWRHEVRSIILPPHAWLCCSPVQRRALAKEAKAVALITLMLED